MTPFLAIARAAESAQSASGGIGALGIDGKMFLFQVANFVVLLFILRAVAFKPILSFLEERRKRIEASLKTATEIETAKKELAEKQQAVLEEAYKKADTLLVEAEGQSRTILKEAENRAKERTDQLLSDAQAELNQRYNEARQALKRETLSLVGRATERVTRQKLNAAGDEALIEQALREAQLDSGQNP